MHKVTYKSILWSFVILFISSAGGWLMTLKAGDSAAAYKFLKFGGTFSFAIFIAKAAIFHKAKRFLFYQILFIGSMGIDLAWFLSCFFLPLMFIKLIEWWASLAMILFYFTVCFFNVRLANNVFNVRWEKSGAATFKKTFNSENSCVNWPAVSNSMKLAAVIFFPGIPKKFEDATTVAMFLFMVLGIVFRSNYPTISMAALSIPFSICAACCLQISTYQFSGAKVVRNIEYEKNIKFKSM